MPSCEANIDARGPPISGFTSKSYAAARGYSLISNSRVNIHVAEGGAMEAQFKEIIESITPERCTDLAVRLVDIPSLTGNEQPIAECIHAILGEMDAASYTQEFEPGRYNTIGRL